MGSPSIKSRVPAPSVSSVEVGVRKASSTLSVPAAINTAPVPSARVQSQAPSSPSRPPPARPPPRGGGERGRGRGRGLGNSGGFAPARPESPQREGSGGWLGSRNPQAAASSPARRQPSFGTQRRQPS